MIPVLDFSNMPRCPTRLRQIYLPAYDDGQNWWVFCKYCQHFHQHGRSEGWRAAHCHQETPYDETEYYLFYAGDLQREHKRIHRIGLKLAESWAARKSGHIRSKRRHYVTPGEIHEVTIGYLSGKSLVSDAILRDILDYLRFGSAYSYPTQELPRGGAP